MLKTWLIYLPETVPKSTLPVLILGFLLGVGVGLFLGWGIAFLLGRRFMFKVGLAIFAVALGLFCAVVADGMAAYKRPLEAPEICTAQKVFGNTLNYDKIRIAPHSLLMRIRGSKARGARRTRIGGCVPRNPPKALRQAQAQPGRHTRRTQTLTRQGPTLV